MPTLRINDGPDGATIEDIPPDVWKRFMEFSKEHFPREGENAWAACLSEVIFAIAGGNKETVTTFMTDIPRENADALSRLLSQVDFTWDKFHGYLLRAATMPDHLRIVNFPDNPPQMGAIIVLGIRPHVFQNIRLKVGLSTEQLLSAIVNAADKGSLSFSGVVPDEAPRR